ncbi:tyrosine-type recombinase/integrase [Desulfitobacterium chlororespirans]|uniref:Phage integrase, N-terminal SAM-like domain n=1 Tax=Desulfitobacterium chlororespirans DSM 11544 TaxID=1121395 RepID=A0A1M7UYK1_9FIRM|nr:site-specific integrase [Desulfitobacterium chlororespirans]SHN87996.1 Phage integrase, N-terminal SAM-like domain [Desulfitobacterium chlororespirans DSM 11544]
MSQEKTKPKNPSKKKKGQRADGRLEKKLTVGYDPLTGKPIRKSIYGNTKSELDDNLTDFKYKLKNGEYNIAIKETKDETFGEWLLTYLRLYKKPKVRPETYTDYVDLSKKHIIPLLGHFLLTKIETLTLQEFFNYKAENGRIDGKEGGLSTRRLHMMYQQINGALAKAKRLKKIPSNPAEEIELPSLVYQEFDTYSPDEVDLYLAALKEDRLYALFLLELTTGLRKGELLGIPDHCFDPNKGTVKIIQTIKRKKLDGEEKSRLIFSEPKSTKSKRELPLLPAVVKQIKRFQAIKRQEKLLLGPEYTDSGLLFTTPLGTPIEPRNLNKKHSRIIKAAGIKSIRIHDLRHTVATILLDDGENPVNVSSLLGHAKTSTTLDIYGHSSLEGKAKAVSRLSNKIKAVK